MQDASLKPRSTTSKRGTAASLTGFEKHRKSATQLNLKFIIVGAVVVVAAVVIVVTAMQGNSVYYYTVAEFQDKVAALGNNDQLRVSGMVLPGSIQKSDTGRTVTFTAIDKVDKTKKLTVTYSGVVPDTFKDEAEVVVTGAYTAGSAGPAQGVFQAKEMLAKCPSKYSSEQ
jgi:cytochrome c-type biogenesis protein CcmE